MSILDFTKPVSDAISVVVNTAGRVIDSLHTSTEEKEKLKAEFQKVLIQGELQKGHLTAELTKLHNAEVADLRKLITAEVQSKDSYVRRARPTFTYMGIICIGFSILVIPLVLFFRGEVPRVLELPSHFWTTFIVWMVGYGGMRTAEKFGINLGGKK